MCAINISVATAQFSHFYLYSGMRKKMWGITFRATFVISKRESGKSVGDLSAEYGMAKSKISNFTLFFSLIFLFCIIFFLPCKWVPVTTAWHVLSLRMEESPPVWRVAANKLNKQSRTADEGWSSSLGVGRGANNASP
jgi:hypothetical protein